MQAPCTLIRVLRPPYSTSLRSQHDVRNEHYIRARQVSLARQPMCGSLMQAGIVARDALADVEDRPRLAHLLVGVSLKFITLRRRVERLSHGPARERCIHVPRQRSVTNGYPRRRHEIPPEHQEQRRAPTLHLCTTV